MDNYTSLRDQLLHHQGIDPAGPSEDQLQQFRVLLVNEERRSKRYQRLNLLAMGLWVAVMLGLIMSERLLEALHIPFVVAGLGVMAGLWALLIPTLWRNSRKLCQSQGAIHNIKQALPEHQGRPVKPWQRIAVQCGSQRFLQWPTWVLIMLVAWGGMVLVGNAVMWLLTRGASTFSVLPHSWMILLMLVGWLWMLLRGPLEDLSELPTDQWRWIPLPNLSGLRISARVPQVFVTGVVTVMVVLAGVILWQENTVYAKAMTGFKRAGSFHVVGYRLDEQGGRIKTSEIWHRGVKTRIRYFKGASVVDLYDNGRDQWQYTQGQKHAMHRVGDGSLLPGEITETCRYLKRAQRDSTGDRLIEREPCVLYKTTLADIQYLIWVDGQQRLRRFEEKTLVKATWQLTELAEVEYDVAVDRDLLEPRFDPGVTVVEPGAMLEKRYSLANSIATNEVFGLQVAVHELVHTGDTLFLTCSVRPTEAALAELDARGIPRHALSKREYGSFQAGNWWQRKANGDIESRPYAITNLGQVVQHGVYYCWYALHATGQWPGMQERFDVCGYVHCRGSLQTLRQQQGESWYKNFRPLMTLPMPDQETPLDVVVDDLHMIQPSVTGIHLSAKHIRTEISRADFATEVNEILQGLRPYSELWQETGPELRFRLMDVSGQIMAGTRLLVETKGGRLEWRSTDEQGQVLLQGPELTGPANAQSLTCSLYAVHESRQLVAYHDICSADYGRTTDVIMHPGCRVTGRIVADAGRTIDRTNIGLSRSAPNGSRVSPRRLLTRQMWDLMQRMFENDFEGDRFEMLLLPGWYELRAVAHTPQGSLNASTQLTIDENQTELDLGEIKSKTR